MNYIEEFKNLRTNNKYGRKSPHKAVLMLAVIYLYEQNIISENEIYYNEQLKSAFLKIWNKVLPEEPLFHPNAYLPFWYLQSDHFWHVVPQKGEDEILSLMRDTNEKPSEEKLYKSVKYAELDVDLYFMMTIPSGRSSLKKVLLETYTNLTVEQIDKLSESKDTIVDHSTTALSEYESIISRQDNSTKQATNRRDNELVTQFNKLPEDIQICINLQYYSFLKSHRSERELFKEICPSVYDLYDRIANHPIAQQEISPSFAFIYENFLADLRINLISEDGSIDIIDKIGEALDVLRGKDINSKEEKQEVADISIDTHSNDSVGLDVEHVYVDNGGNFLYTETSVSTASPETINNTESRKGKAWTQEEEKLIAECFRQGKDIADIAERVGRTEVAIKSRLGKLGLIDYTYGEESKESTGSEASHISSSKPDFSIENGVRRSFILNKRGDRVFTVDGKLKYINGELYRLNLKDECFTLKHMEYDGEVWLRGDKKIVAYPQTELYRVLSVAPDYCEAVEDIVDSSLYYNCRIKVDGVWYNYKGFVVPGSVNQYQREDKSSDKKHAILRALSFFRLPASVREISRTISRSTWGGTVREEDVERVIRTMQEVENIGGRYIRKKKE